MDESDINKLFMRVAVDAGRLPDDVRRVFSILVSSTLKYRDRVKKEQGRVLTVGDVRATLDWLMESLRTGKLPDDGEGLRLDLLKIWLDELRPYL